MKKLISVLACLTAVSGATTALADVIPPPPPPPQPPSSCQVNSFVARAYQSGFDQGIGLVDSAWLKVNNCSHVDRFYEIIYNDIQSYTLTGTSAYSICRYTGLTAGAFQELDAISTNCSWPCCREGTVMGKMSGEIYCQLSILLGGLAVPDDYIRRPLYRCGASFLACCSIEFVSTSKNFFAGPGNTSVACLPYTDVPYYTVWDGMRESLCNYPQ